MKKTMNEYQLNVLRKRFAERGYEPRNRHRSHRDHFVIGWVAVGVAVTVILSTILFF